MAELFGHLPKFPPALSDAELYCLHGITAEALGEWDLLAPEEWSMARKLERRGLIKISRCNGDLSRAEEAARTLDGGADK